MRIALAQINTILADFTYNRNKILEMAQQALQKKCDLVVFPECTLFGYLPFDLLERADVVKEQEREFKNLVKLLPAEIGVIVGLITKNPHKKGRPYFNSAALISKNKIHQKFNKQILPTGDVFDEARFIESGDFSKNYFEWKGRKFFLTICEDIWGWEDKNGKSPYKENPLARVKPKKTDLIINLSASPYYVGKMKRREYMTKKTAQYFKAPIMYANLVGGQDEIIFDGSSYVMDPSGKKLLTCLSFQEDMNVFELETEKAWNTNPATTEISDLHKALVLGIQDFCQKTGIQKAHLGLSGGIDSALVAALAVDALGPNHVMGFALPGPFSSDESLDLAKALANNLQIEMKKIDINPIYERALGQFSEAFDLGDFGITHENLQSRLRGLSLMAYANKENSMLLTTGNKSEMATGYATLYGDMCGGLAPIADLTKKQVFELCRYYNQETEVIPVGILNREPTAELRPNQRDQDSLPPYDLLDQSVISLVEDSSAVRTTTDRWLLPKLMKTEFKRWQAPPILKVSAHSFGRGRRYPIAHRAQEVFLKKSK